jgi:hypothetical protein
MMERVQQSTAPWVIGVVACGCNILALFLPFGIVLGIIALILGLVHSARRRGTGTAGIVLGALSLLIAVLWAATIGSVFLFDPTL